MKEKWRVGNCVSIRGTERKCQDENSIFNWEWLKFWSLGHLLIIPLLRKLEKRFLKYTTKAKTASLGKNTIKIKRRTNRYTSNKGIPSVKEQKVIKSWREFVFSSESPLWSGVNREQKECAVFWIWSWEAKTTWEEWRTWSWCSSQIP